MIKKRKEKENGVKRYVFTAQQKNRIQNKTLTNIEYKIKYFRFSQNIIKVINQFFAYLYDILLYLLKMK